MSDAALRLRGVSKSFGGVHAVSDVDLAVAPGERVAILGANGAGKTTLFNLISGVARLSSGEIWLSGRDVTRTAAAGRARMGLARTFQITEVVRELTLEENVILALAVDQRRGRAGLRNWVTLRSWRLAARERLERWGLGEHHARLPGELSYGHQRLLELVLALVREPVVLLLDEPTAGLSRSETDRMLEALGELPPSMALLVIEHDVSVAAALAPRAVFLHQGSVLMDGEMESVRADATVNEIYLGGTPAARDGRA